MKELIANKNIAILILQNKIIKILILLLSYVILNLICIANKGPQLDSFQFNSCIYANSEDEDDDNDDQNDAQDSNQDDEISDPLIKINRKIYILNSKLDYILKPYAKIYGALTTKNFREAIDNALDNYKAPISVVNSTLQKDGKGTALHFWRFIINSTLGCFGLVDIASKLGLEKPMHKNFGSTLAYFGVKPTMYIMLPVFGPTNARDMWDLLFFNATFNYANYIISNSAIYSITSIGVLHIRESLIPFEKTLYNFPDAYTFIKTFLHNKRQKELNYINK